MKIAIASGKGGTGKTTVSVNLAAYMSSKYKIILTDLDVEEPNSSLFIDKENYDKTIISRMVPHWNKSTCISCGKCNEVCNFNAVIQIEALNEVVVFPQLCHSCFACSDLCPTLSLPMGRERVGLINHYYHKKFDLIEGVLDIGQEQAVPLIAQTIAYTDKHYSDDYIKIFDSPPGTSCPVIEAVKDSDLVLLVTEPTPFGLNDLKISVEVMRKLNQKFGVIVNRAESHLNLINDYCQIENIPLITELPQSRKIAELYSQGKLIYRAVSQVENEFEKISQFIEKVRSGK
jgi:MinD superfamily P-loop ATPase